MSRGIMGITKVDLLVHPAVALATLDLGFHVEKSMQVLVQLVQEGVSRTEQTVL